MHFIRADKMLAGTDHCSAATMAQKFGAALVMRRAGHVDDTVDHGMFTEGLEPLAHPALLLTNPGFSLTATTIAEPVKVGSPVALLEVITAVGALHHVGDH